MRKAKRIDTETDHLLAGHIEPGITTGELDHLADRYIRSRELCRLLKVITVSC